MAVTEIAVLVSCLVFIYLLRGTAAASSDSNFTSSSPVCPGSEVNFTCTVVDPGMPFRGSTIWRVGTNSLCGLAHSAAPIQQQSCSVTQFSASLAAPEGDCYTSTISATVDHADSGLPVSCYAFEDMPSRLVGNASVEVIVPPQAPPYSCSLTEGSGSTTRVTLTWTEPPSGDSIDQYCIIIISPESPSARSVCVTTDMRTHQYEVQQGLEYNFTILAVNCGNQNGTETAPISVFPQVWLLGCVQARETVVMREYGRKPQYTDDPHNISEGNPLQSCIPQAPPTPEVSAVYNKSSAVLVRIETTWSEVDVVVVSEQCDRGRELNYVVVYGSSSGPVANVTISPANCANSECRHTLDVSTMRPANYTVSVAAVNVVGEDRSSESRTISYTNTLLSVEVDAASNSAGVSLQCQFASGVTGTASCLVRYGNDPSYLNLPLRNQMSQNLTNGGTITVPLTNVQMVGSAPIYYVVLAQTDSQSVSIVGFFRRACVPSDLGGSQMDQLDERCGNNYAASVEIPNGVVCYDGSSTGAEAVYFCNDGYRLEGERRRVCQSDGLWNGSVLTCDIITSTPPTTVGASFPVWAIAVTAVGVLAIVAVVLIIVIFVCYCFHYKKRKTHIYNARNKSFKHRDPVELNARPQSPRETTTLAPRVNTLITKSFDISTQGKRKPSSPPPSFAQESWYHGDVTTAGLQTLFSNAAPGQYIVRDSTSRVGEYSVSVKGLDRIHHFVLQVLPTGGRVKIAEKGGTWYEFDSMSDLLENYTHKEPILKTGQVFLGEPIHMRESLIYSM